MCPYPLKVQARPPRDQILVTHSRVSGRVGWGGDCAIEILNQLRSMSERLKQLICLLKPKVEVILSGYLQK